MNMATVFTSTGQAVTVGESRNKVTKAYRNGYYGTVTMTATVKSVTDGYRDPLTGEMHSVGVQLAITDSKSSAVVHASLDLESFVRFWVA